MQIITEAEAVEVLAPYHNALCRVVDRAWFRWNDLRRAFAMPRRQFQAQAMNELMVEEARREFGAAFKGLHLIEKSNRFMVMFEHKALVRFKKLDAQLRTSNYPTQASLRFDHQMELAGMPQATRITVGYVLNPLGTELVGVYVVCSRGKVIEWSYRLTRQAKVTALPSRPRQTGPRVRAKANVETKADTKSNEGNE